MLKKEKALLKEIFAKTRKKVLFVLMMGCLGFSDKAECSSLDKALTYLYKTSLELQAKRAEMEATMEDLPITQSEYRPSIGLQGSYGRTNNNYEGTTGTSHSEKAAASAELRQKIVMPKYAPSIRKVRASIEAAEFSLLDAEQTVLLSAVEAYMNLYRDLQVLEVQRANTAFLEKNLEFVQARYDIGDATLTDLSQVKGRLAESKAELAQAEGQAQSSRSTYTRVVGIPPQRVAKILLPKGLVSSKEKLVIITLQNSPTLKSARASEKAARATMDIAESEFLPSVDVVASAGRTGERIGDPKYRLNDTSVKAVLNVPFDLSGKLQAGLRKSHQLLTKAIFERKVAETKAKEEAQVVWSNFSSAKKRYNEFSKEIKQAAIALQSVQLEMQAGSRTVAEVLEARKELLKAQVSQAKIYRDLMVAAYGILKTQGILTARSLGLPVEYYNAKSYLEEVDGKWWGLGKSLDKPKSFMLRHPR